MPTIWPDHPSLTLIRITRVAVSMKFGPLVLTNIGC
jgi:hypothetical protein